MNVEMRREIGYRIRLVRERAGWSREGLAERMRVHPGSVARWETGGALPHRYHLERIGELTGADPGWLRTGEGGAGEHDGDGPAKAPEPDAEELFASFDAVVRFLGGIAPPGAERFRKLDALEGLRRMLTARGLLPDWWYELRDRVEADEV